MQKSAIIAVVAAILLPAAPALAQGPAFQIGSHSFNVHLSDLDLSTGAGRAQALVRIEKVAANVCKDAGMASDRQACQDNAVKAAVVGFNAGMLRLALEERSTVAATTQLAAN